VELQEQAAALEEQTAAADAARLAAQEERDRAALVAEAGALLASSLDVAATLAQAARLAVPAFADYCLVDLLVPAGGAGDAGGGGRRRRSGRGERQGRRGRRRRRRRRGRDGAADGAADAGADGGASTSGASPRHTWIRRWSPCSPAPPRTTRSARRGRTARCWRWPAAAASGWWSRWTTPGVGSAARGPEHLAAIRRLAPRSIVVAGLRARGAPLGVITFVRSGAAVAAGGRPFGPEDPRSPRSSRRAPRTPSTARGSTRGRRRPTPRSRRRTRASRPRSPTRSATAPRPRRRTGRGPTSSASMSHELRTPLNAIQGYVALLEEGIYGPLDPPQREAVGRVGRAQAHLLALVNDVLNFTRLEEGRVAFDVQAVPAADVVRDVVPLIAPQLRAKGLALDVVLPDAPVLVWADREKLGQVLLNLLANAASSRRPCRTTARRGGSSWPSPRGRTRPRWRTCGCTTRASASRATSRTPCSSRSCR
jgi:hypothetical protein